MDVLRRAWPEIGVRSAMMFGAIEVISALFSGKVVKHRGDHFMLESAKLYMRPEQPVPIYVATAGPLKREADGQERRRDDHGGRRG